MYAKAYVEGEIGYWQKLLPPEALAAGAAALSAYVEDQRNGKSVYPPNKSDLFRALYLTQPKNARCVILGQDPYHEPGQATGLAFSVSDDTPIPPSLRNILKELQADQGEIIGSSDLTPWAKQGVLLLNTVLSVERGKPNSHQGRGWEEFASAIIEACFRLPQPIVFLCWGAQAVKLVQAACAKQGPVQNKHILCSTHPSPLAANRGTKDLPAFIGSRPFSAVNGLLAKDGVLPIDWTLQKAP